MRKFAKGEEEAEVNMTPMLDIVFIMLIFFIVTATFVKESGIGINTPEDLNKENPPPPEDDKRAIAFLIDNNNRIQHNFRPIDISAVTAIIKKESVERPEAPIVIQTEDEAEFGLALRIYDNAIDLGISQEKVVIVPRKKK